MRMLTYKIDKEIIKKIEDEDLYIVDDLDNFEDAIYHLEVRFYNLVLVYESDIKNCIKLLYTTYNKNTAFIIISDNVSSGFELKCFKNGALNVIEAPVEKDLLMARIEAIHRDNFCNNLPIKDSLSMDRDKQEIYDDNSEVSIKGKAFDILRYLVQNKHRPPISKDELMCALWDEPEMVNLNVIEVNINQIRTKLKKEFNVDLIDTVRNRGYKLKQI